MRRINCPNSGMIVRHTGWGFEKDENYPCDIYVERGNFYVDGRLSNWWYWKRILPDGTLSDTESGYGSFEECPRDYEIEIRVKCTT